MNASDANPFSSVEDALDEIRAGRFVVVVDNANPLKEGGLTIAAEHATPSAVNFMTAKARGPLYLCLSPDRCNELRLLPGGGASSRSGALFMASIEAREGITSGVSAHDRARTIQLAVAPTTKPSELVQPGHVPVLRSRAGGVLERARQTEAAVDIPRLAGLGGGGVVSEIMKEDGSMAVLADLVTFCREHALRLITISDLVAFRRQRERLVERMVSVRMPTSHGEFTAIAFRELLTGAHHVALVKGEVAGHADTLVRVHTQCLLGDVFHSTYCDCHDELEAALARVEREGRGVVLYVSRPQRGFGLLRELAAPSSREEGPARREAEELTDARDYGIGSQILADLGLTGLRLLTDNPRDLTGIESYGISVVEQIPLSSGTHVPPRRQHHQDVQLDALPD